MITAANIDELPLSVNGLRWVTRANDERMVTALRQQCGLNDVLARLLVGRGIGVENAENYLSPSLRELLPDPSHLLDMDKAVERTRQAIEQQQKIGIFGDYDVDGATSSALLTRYFAALGVATKTHIPDRQKEGYGPNINALLGLQKDNCKLVITVDCGATAFEPLEQASAAGIDVVVLDHHIGAPALPKAIAVVNPNRLDETTPHTYLAAVGVTFLFLVGLNRALRQAGRSNLPDLMQWLDIVALGSVCDVVPLVGANRALVTQGLKIFANRQNLGLRQLMDNAGVKENLSAYHLGFVLGPRINAGGRVGESSLGAELLAGENLDYIAEIAQKLENYNAERKAIEDIVLEQALADAELQKDRQFIMVARENWHAGVIGIVAGRLKERHHKPVAVLALENGIAKASARSVGGADIGAAVAAARTEGLLISGGGHAMAAGFSVAIEQMQKLQDFLEAHVQNAVEAHLQMRKLSIDAWVSPLALTGELAETLSKAAPYGMGNPSPRLAVNAAKITGVDILKEQHIRLSLLATMPDGKKNYVKAMAFRSIGTPLGDALLSANGRMLHLAGEIKRDFWQGREQVTFFIEDVIFAQ